MFPVPSAIRRMTRFPGLTHLPFARRQVLSLLALAWAAVVFPVAAADADATGAKWQIDNANSTLSFVTVKAADVAETHRFGQLSGGVTPGSTAGASAEVNIAVHLASVDTNIPIRDERMREHLFETGKFPLAKIHGHVQFAKYLALPTGDSVQDSLKLMLDLHGERIPITADVLVSRLGSDRVMVMSSRPIIVNASQVGLVAGIEKLRELAGLPSISKAVPASFVLTLVR